MRQEMTHVGIPSNFHPPSSILDFQNNVNHVLIYTLYDFRYLLYMHDICMPLYISLEITCLDL